MDAIEEMLADPHVAEVVEKFQLRPANSTAYFKWTCGSCGERVTCDQPNSLFTSFIHEDCGYETRTQDGDLGFLLVMQLSN